MPQLRLQLQGGGWVRGFSDSVTSGPSNRGSWFLSRPRDLAEVVEGRQVRAFGHQLLVYLAAVADGDFWHCRCLIVSASLLQVKEYWAASATPHPPPQLQERKSTSWSSLCQVIVGFSASHLIYGCFNFHDVSIVYWSMCILKFAKLDKELKGRAHWSESLSVTCVITF